MDATHSHARIPGRTNTVAGVVVDSALAIHRAFGPGLLESVYEQALAIELTARGLRVARQVPATLRHRGLELSAQLRIDLFVERCVIVEVKAVEALHAMHRAQLLTYLRFSDARVGLLINFNTILLRDGIRRVVT